ncbi:MAG TPA: peptide ABC transporter substrate-binding protein [Pyrinomonadaceae bacterium]|nr:peptide ABC transporter substrate-binding protein [Pyrinomonadaceae bacterium]
MTGRKRQKISLMIDRWRVGVASLLLVVMSLTGGCFLDHEVEPYYGRAVSPRAQEFRWSDGGLPQVFDPALAAVPPDTDAVRAIYEGLTEYDSKTLAPVPGVAARWESSSDSREWIFHLRRDARWSTGEPVTAQDFVRSWQRTAEIGDRAPHAKLLRNIQGVASSEVNPSQPVPAASPTEQAQTARESSKKEEVKKETKVEAPKPVPFGAEAIDDYTLRVRLQRPDPGFPALASHPIFRPVYKSDAVPGDAVSVSAGRPISNGAFQLSKVEGDAVVLERAKNYWDAQAVSLQRVQFVPTKDAESALAAYRAGDVDAVTNAGFEPLALKLLAPYKDFRRATFGALTYYSFNTARPPFDDARVREALNIAIDRDRISEDQLGGATEPAKKFLPAQMPGAADAAHAVVPQIERDVERARKLLADAGYPEGQKFPRIRLLVNRNAQQRQIAETIAQMWRNALGVETEIVLKDWEEYEIAFRAGDYDVARRSYVMQTADESSSLREMFETEAQGIAPAPQATAQSAEQKTEETKSAGGVSGDVMKEGGDKSVANALPTPLPILSEAQALKELPAMPIYFASSYALVKPYVVGFETNLLDAPSLKRVRIDTSWQQQPKQAGIWFKSGE